MQKNNTGMWIFLSVLLVVVAFIGLVVYSGHTVNKEREEAAAAKEEEQTINDSSRNQCLIEAEDAYNSYIKLNAIDSYEKGDETIYTADQEVWDTASEDRTTAKNECYRQYGYN